MEQFRIKALTVKCKNCGAGRSVEDEDFNNEFVTCHQCGNKFTVYEGLKNGLKDYEDSFMPNPFLANYMINEIVDVKIGYETYFSLPDNVKKVYKVNIIPIGGFIAGEVDVTKKGFRILTSLPKDGDETLIGKQGKVMLMINSRIDDYGIQWLDMLQFAQEQLRNEGYLTCVLFSEIAFEIFIDTVLANGYRTHLLDEDTISRFLVSIEMLPKVNPLMFNLYKIKLSKSDSWGNWEKKVLKWRNEIAHGTKVKATEEEAKLAYDTVVDSIMYINEGINKFVKESSQNLKSTD